MSNEQDLEARLSATAVAPRVTQLDVEDNILGCHFFTAHQAVSASYGVGGVHDDSLKGARSLKLLTFCVIVLKNGFTVTGESACASPENYNREIGEEIARKNAVAKIWALMGYELRSKLMENSMDWTDRLVKERNDLQDKLQKLDAFDGTPSFFTLAQKDQDLLVEQGNEMRGYLSTLNERIKRVGLK